MGRATAHAFAEAGAQLVLAARGAEGLASAATECRALGASCFTHPVDVADAGAVESLRDAAISHLGRIDIWVNCAAVLLLGGFEDLPLAIFAE